jgi:hypothetical protein
MLSHLYQDPVSKRLQGLQVYYCLNALYQQGAFSWLSATVKKPTRRTLSPHLSARLPQYKWRSNINVVRSSGQTAKFCWIFSPAVEKCCRLPVSLQNLSLSFQITFSENRSGIKSSPKYGQSLQCWLSVIGIKPNQKPFRQFPTHTHQLHRSSRWSRGVDVTRVFLNYLHWFVVSFSEYN